MSKAKSDEHMEPGEADWKFKRIRNDSYLKNCDSGYRPSPNRLPDPDGSGDHTLNEVHHVLNVHSCNDANFPKEIDREFIFACFKITSWDINGAKNVIGLPKKWAYVIDVHGTSARPGNAGWHNLPCHQVDHDHYWRKVDDWVRDEIFKKLQEKQARDECGDLIGDDIAQQFESGSDTWREFLNGLGSAKAALEYCYSGVVEPTLEATWFFPFSLSPTGPRRRVKPPPNKRLARSGLLKDIQQKVR